MRTLNLVRWGALAAMASGALWVAGGLLQLAFSQDPPGALGSFLNYLGTAVFSAAYLGMLGGLVVFDPKAWRAPAPAPATTQPPQPIPPAGAAPAAPA